ncbi:hypothetical protein Hanom_Chr10g00956931 [Helianthus anomalus]
MKWFKKFAHELFSSHSNLTRLDQSSTTTCFDLPVLQLLILCFKHFEFVWNIDQVIIIL